MFAKHVVDKGLLSKIFKELWKLNSKKTTWLKKATKTLTDISPKIYRWQIVYKKCPHHVIMEMQIKATWDTTTHLLEWPQSRTLATQNDRENMEQQELSFTAGGNEKWYRKFDSLVVIFTKLNTLLWNPAILLLGIYQREMKTCVHTKTCTWIFRAALFITAKMWKEPRCSSVGDWINTLCYIQSME